MTRPTACETCLADTTGQPHCSKHPHATMLYLDTQRDQEWLAMIAARRRQARLRRGALLFYLLEVVAVGVFLGTMTGSLMIGQSFMLVILAISLLIVTPALYLFWESHQEQASSSPAAEALLPEERAPEVSEAEVRRAREDRRERRTERSNMKRRISKASNISASG